MQTKGFLASLFDYSFRSLITTKIIKFVYVLTTIVVAVYYLAFAAIAFSASTVLGVLVLLVFGPILSLVELIWARILLELVIAQFRIMEDTGRLVTLGEVAVGGAAGGGAPEPEDPGA
jgi:hypothetical protein